jgi:predicted secreted hydrolase
MRIALAMLVLLALAACDGRADSARVAQASDAAGPAPAAQSERASASPGNDSASTASAGDDSASAASPGNNGAPADATRLGALRASTLPPGFDLVTAPRPFEFPLDHGPHPSFRHEWWYVTGHLDSANREPFGFELTFFRFALVPPGSRSAELQSTEPRAVEARTTAPGATAPEAAEPHSAWRARQIYMAHFAVTDIERKQFAVSERFARDALGLAGARADPFRVSLDDWSLAETGSSKTWRLVAADKGYALDLEIDPSAPLMLNGNAGFSQKSDAEGAASYYYSIPRMRARGKLTRDGKSLDVQGTVWLDREWGSGALGVNQQGWDWFALQLDDGSALMFYALRDRDGRRDPHSAGTWLAPNGATQPLATEDVQITSTAEWTSPRGARYPARWHLTVPKLNLDVVILPRLANQELNTSTRYWEGASTVNGTRDNKKIAGKAYVELVGY